MSHRARAAGSALLAAALATSCCAWAASKPVRLIPGAERIAIFGGDADLGECARLREVSVRDGALRWMRDKNSHGSYEDAIARVRNAALRAGGNAVYIVRAAARYITDTEWAGTQWDVRATIHRCPPEALERLRR